MKTQIETNDYLFQVANANSKEVSINVTEQEISLKGYQKAFKT